jgi:hypothetical protein
MLLRSGELGVFIVQFAHRSWDGQDLRDQADRRISATRPIGVRATAA